MRRRTEVLASVFYLLPWRKTAGLSTSSAGRHTAVRADSVFRVFDRSDSPGCVLGVYQDGAIRYARGLWNGEPRARIVLSPARCSMSVDLEAVHRDGHADPPTGGEASLEDPTGSCSRRCRPTRHVTWRRALSRRAVTRSLVLWGPDRPDLAGDTVDALHIITARPNTDEILAHLTGLV